MSSLNLFLMKKTNIHMLIFHSVHNNIWKCLKCASPPCRLKMVLYRSRRFLNISRRKDCITLLQKERFAFGMQARFLFYLHNTTFTFNFGKGMNTMWKDLPWIMARDSRAIWLVVLSVDTTVYLCEGPLYNRTFSNFE